MINKFMFSKSIKLAERMGFEPMKELLLYTLSKRAPSTTRPPLHNFKLMNYNILVIIIYIKYIEIICF